MVIGTNSRCCLKFSFYINQETDHATYLEYFLHTYIIVDFFLLEIPNVYLCAWEREREEIGYLSLAHQEHFVYFAGPSLYEYFSYLYNYIYFNHVSLFCWGEKPCSLLSLSLLGVWNRFTSKLWTWCQLLIVKDYEIVFNSSSQLLRGVFESFSEFFWCFWMFPRVFAGAFDVFQKSDTCAKPMMVVTSHSTVTIFVLFYCYYYLFVNTWLGQQLFGKLQLPFWSVASLENPIHQEYYHFAIRCQWVMGWGPQKFLTSICICLPVCSPAKGKLFLFTDIYEVS